MILLKFIFIPLFILIGCTQTINAQQAKQPVAVISTRDEAGKCSFKVIDTLPPNPEGTLTPVIEKKWEFATDKPTGLPLFKEIPKHKNISKELFEKLKGEGILIPNQGPLVTDEDLPFIKDVTFRLESAFIGNSRYFYTKNQGKRNEEIISIYKYTYETKKLDANGNRIRLPVEIVHSGRLIPDAAFMTINDNHQAFGLKKDHFFAVIDDDELDITIQVDTRTGLPAFSTGRIYMDKIVSQINRKDGGLIRFRDGSSIHRLLSISAADPYNSRITGPLGGKNGTPLGYSQWAVLRPRTSTAIPRVVSPRGIPMIIAGGTSVPGERPGGPKQSIAGLGKPPGREGSFFAGQGGVLGPIYQFLAENAVMKGISFQIFFDILTFEWGDGKNEIPKPSVTADGRALNVYFAIDGHLFVVSIADTNRDGVYDADIWALNWDEERGITYGFYLSPEDFKKFTR